MKKLSLILSSIVIFGTVSFAMPMQAKTDKKTDKKEVKKVPAKKKADTKKDTKTTK